MKFKCTISARGNPCRTVMVDAINKPHAVHKAKEWAKKEFGPGVKKLAINADPIIEGVMYDQG